MDGTPPARAQAAAKSEPKLRVLVVSDVRLLADGLAQALKLDEDVSDCCSCVTSEEGFAKVPDLHPDIVLLDAAVPDGPHSVRRVLSAAPDVSVVVFGIAETSDDVITWAEAGVAGYISRTTALADVTSRLKAIMMNEQICSARVASSLLRRLSSATGPSYTRGPLPSRMLLTTREMQIVEMLVAGLSNKDIARRLNIAVSTTKSHVHNLLGKLNLRGRRQFACMRGDQSPSPLAFVNRRDELCLDGSVSSRLALERRRT